MDNFRYTGRKWNENCPQSATNSSFTFLLFLYCFLQPALFSSYSPISETHHAPTVKQWRNRQAVDIFSFMSSLSPSSYFLLLHISLCLHLVWRNVFPWCVLLLQLHFSIWSECNSCDQAWCILVRFSYCFSTPFFLPPSYFYHIPFLLPLSHIFLYSDAARLKSVLPASSLCLIVISELYNISFTTFHDGPLLRKKKLSSLSFSSGQSEYMCKSFCSGEVLAHIVIVFHCNCMYRPIPARQTNDHVLFCLSCLRLKIFELSY